MAILSLSVLQCFLLLLARIVAARCFRHIDHWVEQAPPVMGLRRLKNPAAFWKFVAILCVLVIDVIAISAAVAIGYVVLLLVSAPGRAAGTFESLFINAFLVVEVARSLVQTVFSTRYPHLKLFTMSDEVLSPEVLENITIPGKRPVS